MSTPFVFAIPGMMPPATPHKDAQLPVLRDGSARMSLGISAGENLRPAVIDVFDAKGVCLYSDNTGTHTLEVTQPGDLTDYIQQFPAGTFPPTPCKVFVTLKSGDQIEMVAGPTDVEREAFIWPWVPPAE